MTTLRQLLNCSLYDGNGDELGRIEKTLYDKDTKKCLFLTDNGAYSADKTECCDKGITGSDLQPINGVYPDVLGKAVYESTGKALGTVSDAIINKSANIVRLILDNGRQFARGRIAAIEDIVIVKPPKTSAKKQKSVKRPKQKTNAVRSAVPVAAERTTRRRYGDFSFLLGRTADKNITNFYGEIMIHDGATVTQDVLRQAKISGKLIELCLHVK